MPGYDDDLLYDSPDINYDRWGESTTVVAFDRLDPPRIYGTMHESHEYQVMGVGITDTIFLIGHADGIELNAPHQVINMQETVNLLEGNLRSPLMRGMLEAYNAGARDIWIVAAAPMSEYIDFDGIDKTPRLLGIEEWGGMTFYEKYNERLQVTYELLSQYEVIEILVPLEAPFHDAGGVNFFDDLVWNCYNRFKASGYPSFGIIGTQMGACTPADIYAMRTSPIVQGMGDFSRESFLDYIEEEYGEDTRAEVVDDIPYKFGMIISGEAAIALPQSPIVYNGSVAAMAAGVLSNNLLTTGLTYQWLPNAINPLGRDLTQDEIKELARNRINPLVRKVKGKRGAPYNCVIATDNVFMATGSDFWSVVSVRMTAKVIQEIKVLGDGAIGTIEYNNFKKNVKLMLDKLRSTNNIKDYSLNIWRDSPYVDPNQTVHVEIALTPYATVREIYFQVRVGPGA